MADIHSVPGFFGGEDFYDENGQKVGYSVPGIFGGRDFYDADGKPAGYTVDSIICGENFYDEHGNRTGYSVPGVFGGNNYYDADGKPAGWSTDALLGGENIHMNNDMYGSGSSLDPDDIRMTLTPSGISSITNKTVLQIHRDLSRDLCFQRPHFSFLNDIAKIHVSCQKRRCGIMPGGKGRNALRVVIGIAVFAVMPAGTGG